MTSFEKAINELPHYIGGYDPYYHKNPDDLAGLAILQCDLFEEGEDSEVRTKAMYRRCRRYYDKWNGVVG